jgi:hypothetical protein
VPLSGGCVRDDTRRAAGEHGCTPVMPYVGDVVRR